MVLGRSVGETKAQLLARCHEAREHGMDFPTLWRDILRPSSLVIGPPVQTLRDGRARLEICLISGERLFFDFDSNQIVAD